MADAIAVVIFLEVTGRGLFNTFLGGDEIVSNPDPAIVFLQVPLAIRVGSMLRTTVVFDHLGKAGRHAINAFSYALGVVFFVGIAVGGWSDMIKGGRSASTRDRRAGGAGLSHPNDHHLFLRPDRPDLSDPAGQGADR